MTSGFVVARDPVRPPAGLEGAVYAVGNFDGLHLGHQAVISRAVSLARARRGPSALLTFEPHPADFFAGRPVAFHLTPVDIKASLCARLGMSGVVVLTFDAGLAGLPAEEFVDKISRSAARRRRRRGRMGLSFRQRASGQPCAPR